MDEIFIKIRMGLLEHIKKGKMKIVGSEFDVYIMLHLMANFDSGVVNNFSTPYFCHLTKTNPRKIRLSLASLEKKKYIKRFGTRHQPFYPILINKYKTFSGLILLADKSNNINTLCYLIENKMVNGLVNAIENGLVNGLVNKLDNGDDNGLVISLHYIQEVNQEVIKNPDGYLKKFKKDSYPIRLAKKYFWLISQWNKTAKPPDYQEWAKYIDLMIRVDKREPKVIHSKMVEVQNDDREKFNWRKNILSTKKLRKRWNEGKLDDIPKEEDFSNREEYRVSND